ncbi:MAG: alpha/beta hydrolase [Bacteroidota bacterium]|nr:alpha/beta hydrolase [Bacteroidota bacterium]
MIHLIGSPDMSKSVYKNEKSQKIIQDLYDKQVSALNIDFEDIYADTRFGKTHLLKTGNPNGKPILLFHGGNSTTPYYLRDFLRFRDKYLIYAADIMGHPGKSAQTVLSAKNLEYGKWASDVIDGLGFKKMICMGGSYGGGVLMKLMCVSPQKILKAILLVPSGICNASNTGIMFSMGMPMILYRITHNGKWLKKAILPMALDENEIDEDTFEMVKCAFDNVRVKAGMPSNVKRSDMKNYTAPTLIITGEKDVIFPGEKVINRAKKIIPNVKTYLMKGSGHMCSLSSEKNRHALEIVAEFLAN